MELLVAATLLGIAAASLVLLAVQSMQSRETAMARLLRLGRSGRAGSSAAVLGDRAASDASLADQLGRRVASFSGVLSPKAYGPLRAQLVEAGFRSPSALAVYMGARVALALGLAAAALPIAALLLPPSRWPLASLIAAIVGFVAPGVALGALRRRRQRAIFRALPDAIDLMVVCVEAGLGLGAALHRVAAEFRSSSALLAAELELVVLETQAGKSLSAALRALGERCGVSDLNSFTSALAQTERMGTRIADTMRVQSESLRVKRLRVAEEVAQKAPVKMLFPAVLIFAAMLIVAIVPAVFRMMETFSS